jgi:MtrB/PioB family decaheme-associated outer membrane protein
LKEDIVRLPGVLAIVVLGLIAAPVGAQSTATPPVTAPPGGGQKPDATPPTPEADTPQAAADEDVNTGWVGFIDFGARATSVDGDAARFERYRDLGNGLFLEDARVTREAKGWLFGLYGQHVGRRDQRFAADAVDPGRFKAAVMWDQIPMLLSRTTRTLFSGVGTGTLSIEDALQAQVQATPSAIATVFNQFGREFDTKTRRHIADGAVEYFASEALTFRTHVRRTGRDGTIPFGGSFGHSSLVETPAPTRHTLSDVDADAEYVRDPFLLRAGYTGSWFHNDVTALTFDNPFRVTDIAATPSRGRLTLPPSNSFMGVNGTASVKLPYRSRVMAYASIGLLQDAGDPLVPQSINSATTTAPLDRQTVNGEARTSAVNLRFTSRPKQYTDLTVSYRSYEYDNRTPEFAMRERVSYDNAPAAVAPAVHTEPYSVARGTFDADFRLTPKGRTSAGVGYTRTGEDRTHRIFESTTDHVVRLTFDTMSRQWFTARTKYEHAQRRGEGIAQGEALLASIGEQPKLRHFDVANRDRDRVTIIGSVTPTGFLTTSLTFAAGKDDYLESVFGLRDNTHRVYGVGADYAPTEMATFGLSYSFEEYNALQRSRQANPGVQFNDPSRNWAADSSDRTHSVLLTSDVSRIAGKVDLRLNYDFSRGRARYNYITGPVADRTLPEEVPVPTTLPTPTELPPTLSEFARATVDVTYSLTSRLSVGLSYWYDQYRVTDFTLDVDANPELARGQALLMGYLYRPYTANTGWVRLLYRW